MKILVIDDDIDFADGMAEMLTLFGHAVHSAYNCDDGLAAAADGPFDLALVDIGLAGRNGADCARELAELGSAANCILTTGYSADALKNMGISVEEFTVLRKPIKPGDLAPYLKD